MQPALVWIANTNYGRDLLGIKSGLSKVVKVRPNAVCVDDGIDTVAMFKTCDFVYDNIIERWKDYLEMLPRFASQNHTQAKKMSWLSPYFLGEFGSSSSFSPDADPETTSVDGSTQRRVTGAPEVWAILHASAGNVAISTGASVSAKISSAANSGEWDTIERAFILFDTSSLDDAVSITSATITVSGALKEDTLNITPTLALVASNPNSNTTLVSADHTSLGTTLFATKMTYAAFNASGSNVFTLNASGISAITATGVSKFGLREGEYDLTGTGPAWSASNDATFTVSSSDGATAPVLEVIYPTENIAGGVLRRKPRKIWTH